MWTISLLGGAAIGRDYATSLRPCEGLLAETWQYISMQLISIIIRFKNHESTHNSYHLKLECRAASITLPQGTILSYQNFWKGQPHLQILHNCRNSISKLKLHMLK